MIVLLVFINDIFKKNKEDSKKTQIYYFPFNEKKTTKYTNPAIALFLREKNHAILLLVL